MSTAIASYHFYLPKTLNHSSSMVHSSCYKLSMNILNRAEKDRVVIPIEKLGMLAVISANKIMFTPATSEASRDAIPVKISWEFLVAEARDVNSQHLPMHTSFHDNNLEELQQQLTGEFYKALMLADEKYRDSAIPAQKIELASQQ